MYMNFSSSQSEHVISLYESTSFPFSKNGVLLLFTINTHSNCYPYMLYMYLMISNVYLIKGQKMLILKLIYRKACLKRPCKHRKNKGLEDRW